MATGIGLVLAVLLGLIVIVAVWIALAYNGLVSLRNQARNAWAQIDVQLKRRHDLIPNLVETVKGYVKHERETLERVTQARSAAMQAKGLGEASEAEKGLTSALGRLFAVLEQYPDLKANQNFLALQEELASTENRIGFARQYYNDQVMQYNTGIQSVPTNLVAGMFDFQPMQFFQLDSAAEREAPKVQT
jgi:LemA protein